MPTIPRPIGVVDEFAEALADLPANLRRDDCRAADAARAALRRAPRAASSASARWSMCI